jgi:4'-phosphopantetheinyl transferase
MSMCSIAYLDATTAASDRLIGEFATLDDHADAARHHLPRRRRQSLAARALLRAVLALEGTGSPASPWHLLRSPQGYPNVATTGNARRSVSLAHSGAIVACAIAARGTIGVDVERIDAERPVAALARAAFGPTEIAEVEREGAMAFYRIWTLREALAKASGQGFGLLVNRLDMAPGIADAGRRRVGGDEWELACWTLDEGYELGFARLAVAGDASPLLLPWNIAHRFT